MYGLIGKNLHYSLSKTLHESIRPFQYDLIEIDDLAKFMQKASFKGINITNPYKKAVLSYADILDESVKKTGVCNTLVNKNGLKVAYNTDYLATKSLIKEFVPKDSVCGILGNGATSQTYLTVLKELNYPTYVFARHPSESEFPLSDLKNYSKITVLINTTPVGTSPNLEEVIDVPFDRLSNLNRVIDVIYNPYKSKLLSQAEKHNILILNGLLMLVRQAVISNTLFFNTEYEGNIEEDLYKVALNKLLNIVLIGLPFSGKTHYGKILGNRLNKPLIDLDKTFENSYNSSITDYFNTHGEALFRKAEEAIALNASSSMNQLISPGGGIVLNDRVMQSFKQNSVIVYIDLDVTLMDRLRYHSRPHVSSPEDLKKLKTVRHPYYLKYADITIDKNTFDERKITHEIEVKIHAYINYQWSLLKSIRCA